MAMACWLNLFWKDPNPFGCYKLYNFKNEKSPAAINISEHRSLSSQLNTNITCKQFVSKTLNFPFIFSTGTNRGSVLLFLCCQNMDSSSHPQDGADWLYLIKLQQGGTKRATGSLKLLSFFCRILFCSRACMFRPKCCCNRRKDKLDLFFFFLIVSTLYWRRLQICLCSCMTWSCSSSL